MSMLDDLKAHLAAVKAWVVAMEDHLMGDTTAAPPMPPTPPTASAAVESPVVAQPVASPADNSADTLNEAELVSTENPPAA